MLDTDVLKAYETLEGVITKVLKPTNDNLEVLTDEVRSMKAQLNDKYYTKETVDILVGQLRKEIADLQARGVQVIIGSAALVSIVSFIIGHIH